MHTLLESVVACEYFLRNDGHDCAKEVWHAETTVRCRIANWDYRFHKLGWFSANCLVQEIPLDLLRLYWYYYGELYTIDCNALFFRGMCW